MDLVAIILMVVGIVMLMCGYFMWLVIVRTIGAARKLDHELWEKWGSPEGSWQSLWDQNNQLAILDASFAMVFKRPNTLTSNPELAARLATVRRIVLLWNVACVLIAVSVVVWAWLPSRST